MNDHETENNGTDPFYAQKVKDYVDLIEAADEKFKVGANARYIKDLQGEIDAGTITFCKECRIQIYACRISPKFVQELARATKCTVVANAGSCYTDDDEWKSSVGWNPQEPKSAIGFYQSVGGTTPVNIGNVYAPQ